MKLNALLASVEHMNSVVAQLLKNYAYFFSNKQGAFRGLKRTYTPMEGCDDDPTKRGITKVQTTVNEKLDYFEDVVIPHLKNTLSVERTNSNGAATVKLMVDGIDFGELTAAELMRLRNFLTNNDLNAVYSNIPVRSDSMIFEKCTDPTYEGRDVLQTPLLTSTSRTTLSEEYILPDPNLDPKNMPSGYCPKTAVRKTVIPVGQSTFQEFTGEWSQEDRAKLLQRKSKILDAIAIALKEVNDVTVEETGLNCESLIQYLHYGKKSE